MGIKPEAIIKITSCKFPSDGVGVYQEKPIIIKHGIPGQTVKVRVMKNRRTQATGKLLEVIEKAPTEGERICPHYPECGGCSRQTLSYPNQVLLKEEMLHNLLDQKQVIIDDKEPIVPAPMIYEYRNKMEYTFGDAYKGGPLTLGMHRRNRASDVITTDCCRIAPHDFNMILSAVLKWSTEKEYKQYNRFKDEGFVRNLVIRKGHYTGEILVALCTTSADALPEEELISIITELNLKGTVVGIVHILYDGTGDAVKVDSQKIIYGRDWYMEKMMGLDFKVSLFSFFQTNVLGAEVLYNKAMSYFSDLEGKEVFDLFSGTGTLAQIMASKANHVTAVELVKDAVNSAVDNAQFNGVTNCNFIAGDVFEVLKQLDHKPECIMVDPPRAGITPKAWAHILEYNAKEIVYISCNPVTLAENLKEAALHGYTIEKLCPVDQFPHTAHVEAVVLLQRKNR